ncbi:MAG: UDP-N-acetylmuramoyl-L-alanine--D-glutamate ligase [Candidatus Absconditabacterales bacterium]
MLISKLKNKNIAILGFGLEGKSTLNFLKKQKINLKNITVLDINKNIKTNIKVKKITGTNYLDNLDKYDIIFKSAGIQIDAKLKKQKNKIITQVQLFFDNYIGKIIAITASKGKSTISSLIYKILKDGGKKVKLVGNIGNPVLDEIDFNKKNDFVVIELSSYMLSCLKKKNYISILGSIFPEHLDRHGNFKNYVKAKLNILNGSEINIVQHETITKYKLINKNLISYGTKGDYYFKDGFFYYKSKKLFSTKNLKLLGEHNLQNICSAIAVGNIIGIPLNKMQKTISEFEGLPHRMQLVGNYGGIDWIDDAISTTPESTIQAIKTFGEKIDTIFLGGTDRGYNFEELIKIIKKIGIKNIVLFPDSGNKIMKTIKAKKIFGLNIFQTNKMQDAIKFAYQNTHKGKTCLLSTASPSYSLRKNFEEKGDLFKKCIFKFLITNS